MIMLKTSLRKIFIPAFESISAKICEREAEQKRKKRKTLENKSLTQLAR